MKFLVVFAICAAVAVANPVRPKPVPISVGPAIVDDGQLPAGPIRPYEKPIVGDYQPISVGPAIVDEKPSDESSALVQIIINVNSGSGISGSPVVIEDMPTPVIVVDQPEPEPVVVEQPEPESMPVIVVEQPEQLQPEINPISPEVPIIEGLPIVSLPGILN